jgi:hypothetical protein
MKRLFRIFELSKNEQRVVLIVIFILITIAFVGYECRVYRSHIRVLTVPEHKTYATPAQTKDEQ